MKIHLLAVAACLSVIGGSAAAEPLPQLTPSADSGVSLVLLGTQGGPEAIPGKAGIASILTVAGKRYLIDAGDGLTQQLAQADIPVAEVGTVFLTHLHDDHTVGLPGLASFRYTRGAGPLRMIGPVGTERLAEGLCAFMTVNAEIRGAERKLPPLASAISGHDAATGRVFDDGTVSVTAVENTHYHFAQDAHAQDKKSYSYRFETPGKVVVFTGDTGPSAAVEMLAKGADILVAEMVTEADIAGVPPIVREHMLQDHLNPTDVGRMAQAAGVKKLVISHYRKATDADVAEIRRQFSGEIVLGKELDRF